MFSTWRGGRKAQTVDQLRSKYAKYLKSRGAITWVGIHNVFRDLRVRGVRIKGSDLRIERILKFIHGKRKQIVLIDHVMGGSVAHTRVIYGVSVNSGLPELLVMDPLKGFTTLSYSRSETT